MMDLRALGIGALAVLCGCTAGQQQREHSSHAADAKATVQCSQGRITGSLIATQVCTIKEQREAMKQRATDTQDELNRKVVVPCRGLTSCN